MHTFGEYIIDPCSVHDGAEKMFAIDGIVFTPVTADKGKWHMNFTGLGSSNESPRSLPEH